jgi:citronellol/citronellal dehydrogenase
MQQVNARGAFLVTKACVPQLKRAANPHVLMLSPPLVMRADWFAPYPAYAMAKFGMSLCVLAMAEEFKGRIAFNALWPRTAIATAAMRNVLTGEAGLAHCRKPDIVADAAWHVFNRPKSFSGYFLIDDTFLAENGVTDFDQYQVDPSQDLLADFFVPGDMPPPPGGKLEGTL